MLLVPPAPASAGIILVVGDSLSAAYGLPLEQGWVALLQERLEARGYSWRIVNASISGDTTANARARLPGVLASRRPDVVVLALGGNDGLRGLSLEAMKDNLAAMIEAVRSAGAAVLLVGVPLPPNYGPLYTERFQTVYRELARETGVALLPSLIGEIGTERALMQVDGIHPNGAAQPLIRDHIWEALLPLLQATSRGRTGVAP